MSSTPTTVDPAVIAAAAAAAQKSADDSKTNPWKIAIYVILGILGLIAFLLGYVYLKSLVSSGPLLGFIFGIANFIPFGLMLFGLFADVLGQEVKYSITTIMGMFAIWVNYILGKILESRYGSPAMTGGDLTQLREFGWCTIPGMERLESKFTPMSLVVTSAIAVYYITFAALSRSASQNIAVGLGFPVIIMLQLAVFGFSDCGSYYIPLSGSGIVGNILSSITLGAIFGGAAVATVKFVYPAKSPFYNIPTTDGGGGGGNNNGLPDPGGLPDLGGSQKTGGTCSPVEGSEDDAMVCEAYRNGQLVTESLT